jgi:hypothetical protein
MPAFPRALSIAPNINVSERLNNLPQARHDLVEKRFLSRNGSRRSEV